MTDVKGNKSYGKKRKNIFLLHMRFKKYRAKAELTFTPRKEKHMARNGAQRIVIGFVVKAQSIVVGFVVKAQRIVVECLRLDSGLPIITADFAQSLQAPSLRQQILYLSITE